MQAQPMAEAGRKRKRAKRRKDRASASAVPALGGSSSACGSGTQPGAAAAFAVGSHAAAPATSIQLTGLDNSAFASAATALEEHGLVHFTDVALPLEFLTELRSTASALSDQIETALEGSVHKQSAGACDVWVLV